MDCLSFFDIGRTKQAVALGGQRGFGFAGLLHRITTQLDDLHHNRASDQPAGDLLEQRDDAALS